MSDIQYTRDHEWIRTEGGNSRLGITDFAQDQLGDIVYVDLPEVGQEFAAGDVLAEIESTKSVGELLAPAAGTVVEVNDALGDEPTLINSAAQGDGWIVVVQFAEQPADLLDEAGYQDVIA